MSNEMSIEDRREAEYSARTREEWESAARGGLNTIEAEWLIERATRTDTFEAGYRKGREDGFAAGEAYTEQCSGKPERAVKRQNQRLELRKKNREIKKLQAHVSDLRQAMHAIRRALRDHEHVAAYESAGKGLGITPRPANALTAPCTAAVAGSATCRCLIHADEPVQGSIVTLEKCGPTTSHVLVNGQRVVYFMFDRSARSVAKNLESALAQRAETPLVRCCDCGEPEDRDAVFCRRCEGENVAAGKANAVEKAAGEERQRIVAWLREPEADGTTSPICERIAKMIEKGAHLATPEKGEEPKR